MRRRALALLAALALPLAACEFASPAGTPRDAGTDAGAPALEPAPAPAGGPAAWLRRLDRVRRIHASPPPDALLAPVRGVSPSRIADTFGAPRGGGRRHEGVDVFAPAGTPVLAAAGGLVVQVGTNNLGGRVVTVWGDGNRRYYYAHLDGYGEFREGDVVEAGDVLGFVGNTGNARTTPPHLHFGVYDPGWNAIDPLPLLLASD